MGWMGGLANLLNPGDAQRVNETNQAITNTLTPGSAYWQSGDLGLGDTGTAGNALVGQIANVAANNVSANFTPMDQDSAALRSLGSMYQNQLAHGGKAEAAARERATSSMADAGGGGLRGIQNLGTQSEQLSKQAEQVALNERGNAASQANSNTLMAGMMDIRKAALQAAITHANIQKNLAAQQLGNSLQNTQVGLHQQLQGGANSAQYAQQMGEIENNQSQNQLGLGLFGAGAQAASAGLALGTDLSKTTVDPMATVSNSEIDAAKANTFAQFGIDPKTLPGYVPTVADTHQQLIDNGALLNGLMNQSSKITYPTLQSDAPQFLNGPSMYPATSAVV